MAVSTPALMKITSLTWNQGKITRKWTNGAENRRAGDRDLWSCSWYHHLSLYIPGCAEFLSFFIEKIPVSFRISGFFGSITSRCRGGSDCQRMLADKNLRWEKFQSPRGVGVVQTRTSRFSACRTKCVSITSRCRGGSDCKPTSPHGYAANRNLNFKKTFILFHFCHPFDYILAQFFWFVNIVNIIFSK